MKDIVIKTRHLRRELWIWIGCFVILCGWNAYGIALHHTAWSELYTLWYVLLPLSLLFYLLLLPFRYVGHLLLRGGCCGKRNKGENA
ncbi:MAG: hypothetical protein PHV49_03785 [Alistipes sp.]|nr:hypothetical protein [Alistipes sp.]